LRVIADKHGIYLIEDAAHSIGSTYKGRPIGSIADITTFSFFPTKNMTTAEGGAIASIHPELLLRAKRFSRQGLVRNPEEFLIKDQGPWHQEVQEFGLNYRLPDVLCALGINQLKNLYSFKQKRDNIFNEYGELLHGLSGIELPTQRNYVNPTWHLYSTLVDATKRKTIFEKMRENGIGVQVNYIPAYWHPVFSREIYPRGLCPIAEDYYIRQISLPMHFELTQNDLEKISRTFSELVNQ
jgi:dTDP-4-amino-4,6-dideoxygalactose transaminase